MQGSSFSQPASGRGSQPVGQPQPASEAGGQGSVCVCGWLGWLGSYRKMGLEDFQSRHGQRLVKRKRLTQPNPQHTQHAGNITIRYLSASEDRKQLQAGRQMRADAGRQGSLVTCLQTSLLRQPSCRPALLHTHVQCQHTIQIYAPRVALFSSENCPGTQSCGALRCAGCGLAGGSEGRTRLSCGWPSSF